MRLLISLSILIGLALSPAAICPAQLPPSGTELSWPQLLDRLLSAAEYPDSVRARISSQKLSRLEAAMVLNQVMLAIEEAGVALEPDLMAEVLLLTEELRDEIAFLQLRQTVEEQDRRLDSLSLLAQRPMPILSGSLRFYAERLDGSLPVSQAEVDFYGPPPKKTKILLAQELSLATEMKFGPGLEAFLALRNFGYWGVGKYSSGSTGIGFTTAGPLLIDQASMSWRWRELRLKLGRQQLRYGPIGLLIDHRYSPILGFSLELSADRSEADLLLASQFQGLEYYAARLKRDLPGLTMGVHYFFSDYDPNQRELLGIENHQGGGLDITCLPWGRDWRLEAGLYKPHSHPPLFSDWNFGWVAAGDILKSARWRIHFTFGSLSRSFLPNLPPIDRFSQDFPSTDFNRIIYGTRGFNLLLLRHLGCWNLEAESLMLDYLQSNTNLARLTLRARWQISRNINIVFEDFINHRAGKTYLQAGILSSFTL